MNERYEAQYAGWLNQEFRQPLCSTSQDEPVPRCSKFRLLPQCPRKIFVDTSEKSKRRKTGHLRELCYTNEFAFAALVSLKESGITDSTKLVEFFDYSNTCYKSYTDVLKFSFSFIDRKTTLMRKLWL
jgi:hypothetical protein